MLIDFAVGKLERDTTISVKGDSQHLAFASYVRLVNLCLLLFAELCDFEESFSRSQVAVDDHAKEFSHASFALVSMLSSSNDLHNFW